MDEYIRAARRCRCTAVLKALDEIADVAELRKQVVRQAVVARYKEMALLGDDRPIRGVRPLSPSYIRDRDYSRDTIPPQDMVSNRTLAVAEVKSGIDLTDRWVGSGLCHNGRDFEKRGRPRLLRDMGEKKKEVYQIGQGRTSF